MALAPVPPGTPGPIFVGLHFGSVELAAPVRRTRRARAGQRAHGDRSANPVLRDYFERTRGALGMDLLPIRGVAPVLRGAPRARRGAWRSWPTGSSAARARACELFGAPARLPVGPAVLAVETGAPMYALAVHRRRPGRVDRARGAGAGARRGHPSRADGGALEAQARTFERTVAHGARAVVDAAVPGSGRTM